MLLALFLACTPEPAPAPPPPPSPAPAAQPAHDGADHSHDTAHGGIVKTVGFGHVEAVFQVAGVLFYPSDAAQAALPAESFSGTAVIQGPAGVSDVPLVAMGDHLHAAVKLEHGKPATAVLTLTREGKVESVQFDVAAVGLAEHDHTSLHGGQVGMWGDFHLEYAPADGEHRVWISDARRVPVTAGASGSLKDGDTVVPLTFDPATGLLSGRAEGAGTRPVMVDVKVGETSFSLAFNAVAAPR
jgi:hypothetical protein